VDTFGSQHCRDVSKPIDVNAVICPVGRSGAKCDQCSPGFAGADCLHCAAEHYSPFCLPCNCANPNTACQDGHAGSGQCLCKCPLKLSANVLLPFDSTSWKSYRSAGGQPGAVDLFKQSDELVVQLDNQEPTHVSGYSTYVQFTGDLPSSVAVGITISALDVSGTEIDDGFSIYVDAWYEDNTPEWGKVVPLPLGSYDYRTINATLQWSRPIRALSMVFMLRFHSGKALIKSPFAATTLCQC